jgi:hypothetical protein
VKAGTVFGVEAKMAAGIRFRSKGITKLGGISGAKAQATASFCQPPRESGADATVSTADQENAVSRD